MLGGGDVVGHHAAGSVEGKIGRVVEPGLIVGVWEPHGELAGARPRSLVAHVGGEQAAVGQEGAAVGLGLVVGGFEIGGELADLGGRQGAERVAVEIEDAEPGGNLGLAGVLAGDEAAVAGEAHLAVDVAAVGILTGVGDEALGAAVVAVHHQVVALGAEHQVGGRVEGLGLQRRVEADAGHQAVESVGGAGDHGGVVEGQQADAVVGGAGAGHGAGDAAAGVFEHAQVAARGAVVALGHQ